MHRIRGVASHVLPEPLAAAQQAEPLPGGLPPTKGRKRSTTGSAYIIGLTGGSCSGKSSVVQWMQKDREVLVVDGDKLGQAAYAVPGSPCWNDLVKAFGDGIVTPEDRSINRAALGKIVFSDPANKLQQLNGIVWPHIGRMIKEQLSEHGGKYKHAVIDAAVLFEAGWDDLCDEVWVVVVPREESIRRIVNRDKKTAQEAEQRLDSQMSNEERIAKSHVVLNNVHAPEVTQGMIKKAFSELEKRMNA